MIEKNLPSKQYKQILLQTLKDKYDFLILGLVVIATLLVSAFQLLAYPTVALLFSGVKMPSFNLTQNAEPTNYGINLDNLDKGNMVLPTGIRPTDSASIIETNVTPTVTENGQISAIKSGKRTKKEETFQVKEGDSLASIAQEVYGDYNAWTVIAKANNLSSPDQIEVGMKLKIPR